MVRVEGKMKSRPHVPKYRMTSRHEIQMIFLGFSCDGGKTSNFHLRCRNCNCLESSNRFNQFKVSRKSRIIAKKRRRRTAKLILKAIGYRNKWIDWACVNRVYPYMSSMHVAYVFKWC